MKILNYIAFILVLIIGTVAYGETIDNWIEKYGWVISSEYDYYPTNSEIIEMISQLNKVMEQNNSNTPVLWYTKGVLIRLQHGNYYDETYPLGKYHPDNPESKLLIEEYQSYYLKALDLDGRPDVPDHLTGIMLSNIGSDVLGDPEIKARAMKKAGDLARAGKDGTGHEQFEWNTYEARLGIYKQAKDYENYLKTVYEMIERFGSSEELEGYKLHAEEVISKRGGKPLQE